MFPKTFVLAVFMLIRLALQTGYRSVRGADCTKCPDQNQSVALTVVASILIILVSREDREKDSCCLAHVAGLHACVCSAICAVKSLLRLRDATFVCRSGHCLAYDFCKALIPPFRVLAWEFNSTAALMPRCHFAALRSLSSQRLTANRRWRVCTMSSSCARTPTSSAAASSTRCCAR